MPNLELVTMYTNYSAPGVFSVGQNGFGPAAAEDIAGNAIGANNPVGQGACEPLLTGMGSVTPSLVDGVPSSPTGQPWNVLDSYNGSALSVYFDGYPSPNIQFAGVGARVRRGFYQINAVIPSGVSAGNDYLDILTPEAEPSK